MDEVTQEIDINAWDETKNFRMPMLTNEKYVDRLIKNLKNRNISHMVRRAPGGHKCQIYLCVGYIQIYFDVVEEDVWQKQTA